MHPLVGDARARHRSGGRVRHDRVGGFEVDLTRDPPAVVGARTGGKANGLALDTDRGHVWVQTWSERIVAVDVETGEAVGRFEFPSYGHLYRGIAVDPGLGRVVSVSGYQGWSKIAIHEVGSGETKILRTGCGPMDGSRCSTPKARA